MLNFLKENSNNILKLSVNQIAMTIFALLLSAASFSNNTLKLVCGLLSILFYIYLLYTAGWDIGARDKIKIDGGRMQPMKFKGIYLGISANAVNFILILVAIFCYFIAIGFELQWAANTTAICSLIAWLLNGMYIAIISFANIPGVNFELIKLILLLIAIVLSVLATQLAYTAGLKNFKLFAYPGSRKN